MSGSLQRTPSQTVGPFFAIGLPWEDGPHVVPEGTPGSLRISGHVYDGKGSPVPDAMIETWQASPEGEYDGTETGGGFRGFARAATDDEGRWEITTVKPGRVEGQAPHLAVSVFMRGLLTRVTTRIYFGDEDNAGDRVLEAVEPDRRATLVAAPDGDDGYVFDIHMQGEHETVFIAV